MSGMLRKISIVALLLLLQACQLNPPKPPSYDSHQSVLDLSQRSNFSFSGNDEFKALHANFPWPTSLLPVPILPVSPTENGGKL